MSTKSIAFLWCRQSKHW